MKYFVVYEMIKNLRSRNDQRKQAWRETDMHAVRVQPESIH
jgi:hypothetical protein